MAVYGFFTNHIGASLASLAMVVLTIYGARELNKRDAEYKVDPNNAVAPKDTAELLSDNLNESGRSTF